MLLLEVGYLSPALSTVWDIHTIRFATKIYYAQGIKAVRTFGKTLVSFYFIR